MVMPSLVALLQYSGIPRRCGRVDGYAGLPCLRLLFSTNMRRTYLMAVFAGHRPASNRTPSRSPLRNCEKKKKKKSGRQKKNALLTACRERRAFATGGIAYCACAARYACQRLRLALRLLPSRRRCGERVPCRAGYNAHTLHARGPLPALRRAAAACCWRNAGVGLSRLLYEATVSAVTVCGGIMLALSPLNETAGGRRAAKGNGRAGDMTYRQKAVYLNNDIDYLGGARGHSSGWKERGSSAFYLAWEQLTRNAGCVASALLESNYLPLPKRAALLQATRRVRIPL